MREEASSEIGRRLHDGALKSLEAQGFTGEGAAARELGRRGRDGALSSLEAEGFTEEGAAASEFGRRGGVAAVAKYRKATRDCTYPGCKKAMKHGVFCTEHQPPKPEKRDNCVVCELPLAKAKRVVRGEMCISCYYKPEIAAIREKERDELKAIRGTCSTPGCDYLNEFGYENCHIMCRRSK